MSPVTPLDLGGTAVTYDTLRTSDQSDFDLGAICLETDGPDLLAFDSKTPPPGTSFAYLTRAVNACRSKLTLARLSFEPSGRTTTCR